MINKFAFFGLICFFIVLNISAQSRIELPLNKDWKFHFTYDVRKNAPIERVDLPHSWNGQDVLNGIMNYRRDQAAYEKQVYIPAKWKNKRFFIFFEGANSFAEVLINNKYVGSHKGGYTSFCFEITDFIQTELNSLRVNISNAARTDILPLTGDFNIYGGLHRGVKLIITDKNCIQPDYYASSGVFINNSLRKDLKIADIAIKTRLSIKNTNSDLFLQTKIYDSNNQEAAIGQKIRLTNKDSINEQNLKLNAPILWNGKEHPYLYKVIVTLSDKTSVLDQIIQPLGVKTFNIQPSTGAYLNNKYINLYGFGFHEDRAGVGSAMSNDMLKEDFGLIQESGANALRMTHYPHSQLMYNLADSSGVLIWSEIPLVGPGGYNGYGYIKDPELETHTKTILKEMILQNYNHPSVMCWGIFNELKLDYDDPIPFLKTLNKEVHSLDSSRYSACASFLSGTKFNDVSDVIAWNKYYGWYGDSFSDMATWADQNHQLMPNKAFAVSEYGAGGDPMIHTDSLVAPDPNGRLHYEEWQSLFHEENWKYLKERNFIWAKFIWALTDFGSSIRTEGAVDGINDKGLVSYDRKIKKDAFYFYKANWNKEPVLYLTEKRFSIRKKQIVSVKAYSNLQNVSLYINGKLFGTKKPNSLCIAQWENVRLEKGDNQIEIKNSQNNLVDETVWTVL